MRKVLHTIMLLAFAVGTYAQNVGEAFYIYLNDGSFEAFFRQEVDSMTFVTAADGKTMQCVYTSDSTYRFPIAAIDSVAFLTPQTIVNEKVFPLTAQHTPYISQGTTKGFVLSASTPAAMRPAVGHIVVATADCDAFPNGIMAFVQSIGTEAGGYRYHCRRATIDDVFDQLVAYERIGTGKTFYFDDETVENGDSLAANDDSIQHGDSLAASRLLPHRIEQEKTYQLWDFGWESEFGEEEKAKVVFGGRDVATVRLAIRKTLFSPLYVKAELTNQFTASMNFHGEMSAEKEWDKQLGKTVTAGKIPLPYTFGLLWLEPKFSLFGYAGISGKVSVDFTAHNTRSDTISFVYHDKKWSFPHKKKDDPSVEVATMNLEGSVELGLKPVIDFSLNGTGASFGLTGKIGLCETANISLDAEGALDGSLYETIKDSYVRTTLPWSLQAQASLNLFEKYGESSDDDKDDENGDDDDEEEDDGKMQTEPIGPKDPPQLGHDIYFLPEFSNVYARGNSGDNSAAWCFATASRPCLLPLTLGFQLFNVMNQPVPVVYSATTYTGERVPFTADVNGLEGGQYTVRPVVSIMGYDLVASPAAEVIKVATFDPQQKDGVVTLRGKVYGTTSDKVGFYYGPHIDIANKPDPATYVEATPGANGEFTATLTDLTPGDLYVAAVADVTDHLGMTAESRGEPLLLTVVAPADNDEPTPGQTVDLGLSVKWAGWNVGASSPEELGGFCGWGMSSVSMSYDGNDYPHADKIKDGGKGKLGQLTQARNKLGSDICSTEYDAAHLVWGGGWRLPTSEECDELVNQCRRKMITYKGRGGILFTGPNGNSIFMPFSDNGTGCYWSGSAQIFNYKNYIYGLSLAATGTIYGSGPSVGVSPLNWSAPAMVRAVVK